MSQETITFVDWLLRELERRDWSQSELHRQSGIAQTHISRVITYDRQPGMSFYRKVADAFRIPLVDVLVAAGEIPDPYTTFENPTVVDLAQRINALTEETRAYVLEMFYSILELTQLQADSHDTDSDNVIQLSQPPQSLEDLFEYLADLPPEVRDLVVDWAEKESNSDSDKRQSLSSQP